MGMLDILDEGLDATAPEETQAAVVAPAQQAQPKSTGGETMLEILQGGAQEQAPGFDLTERQRRGIANMVYGSAIQGHDGVSAAMGLAEKLSGERKKIKTQADTQGFMMSFMANQDALKSDQAPAVMKALLAEFPRVSAETFSELLGGVHEKRQAQTKEAQTNALFLAMRASKGKLSDEDLGELLAQNPEADIGAATTRYQQTRTPDDKVAEEAVTLEARAKVAEAANKRKAAEEKKMADQAAAEKLRAIRGMTQAEAAGLEVAPAPVEAAGPPTDDGGETFAEVLGPPQLVKGDRRTMTPEQLGVSPSAQAEALDWMASDDKTQAEIEKKQADVERRNSELDLKKRTQQEKGKDRNLRASEGAKDRGSREGEGEKNRAAAQTRATTAAISAEERQRIGAAQKSLDGLRDYYRKQGGVPNESVQAVKAEMARLKALGAR